MTSRPVSVIVNTYNRAQSLALTLEALTMLDYPQFEVVVVNGPSTDGTESLLAQYEGRIKIGRCDERNLSSSRNIGVAMAAGEIVAFIDDDAYPDPAWLDCLVRAYEDPEVAAAGGPVFNPTGVQLQCWSNDADRLGEARVRKEPWDRGGDLSLLYGFPMSRRIVYTIGTNSSFVRRRLVEIGGFDEEFEYYLEETDACCRLVDSGYLVRALPDGFVYHKFLPSDIRDERDVLKNRFQVLKSKFYFALKHGTETNSFIEICRHLTDYANQNAYEVAEAVKSGKLTEADREQFEADLHRASDVALRQFLRGQPRTREPGWFDAQQAPFISFPTRRRAGEKLHLCFFTTEYPPERLNGIGRVVHTLATGLAARGHVVHVLTRGHHHDRVDLEEGVWVHRVVVREHPRPTGLEVPSRIWDYSASLLDELERIRERRPVDVVQAPNWDSEGIAVLMEGRVPTVVGLYTPLATVGATDPAIGAALAQQDRDLVQMLELERYCYLHSDGVLACGPAIVREVEERYGIRIPREKLGMVAHGLPDLASGVKPAVRPGKINVLFVGRLEGRKGIDVLLDAVPELIERCPDLVLTVVGDDRLPGPLGTTYRGAFEQSYPDLRGRVQFAGPVDDAILMRFYAGCDIFVAPSRFESFGLILLEAMMFAKPVVASDIGGISEIVVPGETGLLVPPGDVTALGDAIAMLAESESLRVELGSNGRARYEREFTDGAMVVAAERYYTELSRRAARDRPGPELAGATQGGGIAR